MESKSTFSKDKISQVAGWVKIMAEDQGIEDEAGLTAMIENLQTLYKYSDEDGVRILKAVQANMAHKLDVGVAVTAVDHKSWFLHRKAELPMRYMARNREFLLKNKGYSIKVVNVLEDVTDEIMDLFGDPVADGTYQRRGLVIGDVQSGKTNTYTTLCCKAADAGYNVIILLTGTIECLRRQTQYRLDEGFVGRLSTNLFGMNRTEPKIIGAGVYDRDLKPDLMTSTDYDFNSTLMDGNRQTLNEAKTTLLVVKKNARVLDNLYTWLKRENAKNGKINCSMLMIDDEADNASVNTSKTKATAINTKLRELLALFNKATYVGFTATPFANIFIDPDSKEEMLGDDLFPRDFIYCLRSPSNHIGPVAMFSEGGEYKDIVRFIDDAKDCLPDKHRKDFVVTELPASLIEALNCYILGCAMKDLRGMGRSHMSMMINMSMFTAVQESIKEAVRDEIERIRVDVVQYSQLSESEALGNRHIRNLKDTWDREYSNLGYKWLDVQNALAGVVKKIEVRSVNQWNGVKTLNYNDYPDGLRLIAIGGNSFSRGLTLEGLSVSYFYRKAKTYDTLMQAGRWFGYRDGYEDVCRVWMMEESSEYYYGISRAIEELKDEIETMRNQNKTPMQFGLAVFNDIDGLHITAVNKMRTKVDRVIRKSVSGAFIDTHALYVDPENAKRNLEAVERVLGEIQKNVAKAILSDKGNILWTDIPKKYVLEILGSYRPPRRNLLFDTESLIGTIARNIKELDLWDIAVQHGDSAQTYSFGGLTIRRVSRGVYRLYDGEAQMSHQQLSSPSHTQEGLGSLEIKRLEKKYKDEHPDNPKKAVPAKAYLDTPHRKPLLLIYPVSLEHSDSDKDVAEKTAAVEALKGLPVIGLAAGFPKVEGQDELAIVYAVNKVWDKLGAPDFDADEDEGGACNGE